MLESDGAPLLESSEGNFSQTTSSNHELVNLARIGLVGFFKGPGVFKGRVFLGNPKDS